MTDMFDRDTISEDDAILEVRRTPGLLRIYSDQIEMLPQLVQQEV